VRTQTTSCEDNLVEFKTGIFKSYHALPESYDEYFDRKGEPHEELKGIVEYFTKFSLEDFLSFHDKSENFFFRRSISFNVYSDEKGVEKIIPVDLLPRVIAATEWKAVEEGLRQRVQALNLFLTDIYGRQQILKDIPILKKVVLGSKGFCTELIGITPPHGIYVHVAGVDVIRDSANCFKVLEDNLRVPSGVSYVLESRNMMKNIFPEIFAKIKIKSVNVYPFQLRHALHSIAPDNPMMVLLTPGPYNSAYFEHVFLARRMDCPLVQNSDLVVESNKVYLKTTKGLKQVHIIYRRTNDDYIDPTVFNPNSLLGVPGLVKAYLAGNVVLANALGNGVADDKAIYPFLPDIIRYYLAEEPILAQVVTYSALNPKDLQYILANLTSLVIKPVDESGGKGITFGAKATQKQLEEVKSQLKANPRNYIAQPLEELSACPTITGRDVCPRRVDLRPFVVTGKTTWVLPGGLTRTAVDRDSYIVNSSQGGGTKDTWIVE